MQGPTDVSAEEQCLSRTTHDIKYSSKIIKAGALLSDTKLLLETWDEEKGVQENLELARTGNVFGKASRSRVEDVLAIFRQRYLQDPDLLRALVVMTRGGFPSDVLDRILYFQSVSSDPLLRDFVSEALFDWAFRTDREVHFQEAKRWVEKQVEAGRTERPWSEEVQKRVVQGILSTLRDFGLLEGQSKKRVAYPYVPNEAFAFVALQLYFGGTSGERLLKAPAWRLFLLPENMVERFFLVAHQEGLLEYHAAGSVIRTGFPANSLEGYAHFLAGT